MRQRLQDELGFWVRTGKPVKSEDHSRQEKDYGHSIKPDRNRIASFKTQGRIRFQPNIRCIIKTRTRQKQP